MRAPLTSTEAEQGCVLCPIVSLGFCVQKRLKLGWVSSVPPPEHKVYHLNCTFSINAHLSRVVVREVATKSAPFKSSLHVCCCSQLPTCCWLPVSADGYHNWWRPSLSGRDPLLPQNYHLSVTERGRAREGDKGYGETRDRGKIWPSAFEVFNCLHWWLPHLLTWHAVPSQDMSRINK